MSDSGSDVFVVVPVYNHEPYVEKCLRSIFSQTLTPRRLLVIDDGSTDGSAAVCERVLKECPFGHELRIRENRGLCMTLNEGLAASDGEYFAYLGSDDLWMPEFLRSRVELLSQRPSAVLAYGHSYFASENDDVFETSSDYDQERGKFVDGDARRMLLEVIVPISSSVCYRRSALAGLRWNESSRLEDYEMYLRLSVRGPFAFDLRPFSVWRHHSGNTGKDSAMMADEIERAQERAFEHLGIGRSELGDYQRRMRFRYARTMLQHGEKYDALRLGISNLGGARSISELAKFGLRFFVPMSVVESRRRARATVKN